MSKLIIRRAARLDVRPIFEWYEDENVGLGEHFLAELDGILARVAAMPRQFPEVDVRSIAPCSAGFPMVCIF